MAENPSKLLQLFRSTTNKMLTKIRNAQIAYVDFISENPQTVEQIERTAKTASYLYEAFSKNYENSIFVSELVTSTCNLFAYINARLRKTKDFFTLSEGDRFADKLKQALMVVEFSQAFLEMAALKAGGPGARWAIVSLVCLVKAVLRCILLLVFGSGVQLTSQAMSTCNAFISSSSRDPGRDVFYVGPRSGLKMRALDGPVNDGSPSHCRDEAAMARPGTSLDKQETIGELLHALRPMVHLLSIGACGSQSIIPWLTALVTDASSHALLHKSRRSKFTSQEEQELQRRYANLILYLLRTPVYDRTVGPRLLRLLSYLSKKVPLARFACDPLQNYLPVWQKVYFYLWSD